MTTGATPPPRILLLGKNGQVGWELQRSLASLGELIALDRQSAALCGDLSKLDGLRATVRQLKPDIIVNAAAYTAVDKAESEPDLARLINATAPGLLGEEAKRLGALLVHYSTDYVFDGSGTRPWTEADAPAPLNTYGRTKLEGEQAIAASGARHLVFRTSWVHSPRGQNFPRTLLRLAQDREALQVVADQVGAPTSAETVAEVTQRALQALQADTAEGGLYHLCASGETSWHALALHLIEQARWRQPQVAWKVGAVKAIGTADYPTPALRPGNSRLDCRKLKTALKLSLPTWHDDIDRTLTGIFHPS